MALSVPTPIPTPPGARDDDPWKSPTGDYAGIEELDRPELDDYAPDTEPCLPALDWDEADGESGVKPRR